MMGQQQKQGKLFHYHVDLNQRVRGDNPLRKIKQAVDFSFVRREVAQLYGYNGNESVDPAVVLKMLFLLFYEDVSSERELMRIIPVNRDRPFSRDSVRLIMAGCGSYRLFEPIRRAHARGTRFAGQGAEVPAKPSALILRARNPSRPRFQDKGGVKHHERRPPSKSPFLQRLFGQGRAFPGVAG